MVAQVNLLPGLKQDKLKGKRTRQLAISIGVTVAVIAIVVPVILFAYRSTQSLVLSRTQKSINEHLDTIRNFEDIDTMLSVKDNLNDLPALYNRRLYISELFKILPAATPQEVRFSSLEITSSSGFTIVGRTDSYRAVEKLFEALKQLSVEVKINRIEPDPQANGDFQNLLLLEQSGLSGDEVSFTITGQFNPGLISKLSGGSDGQAQ